MPLRLSPFPSNGLSSASRTAASTLPQISSLYIHVPFCARKCSYCAFYSEASSGELINRYVRALIIELEQVAHDLQPATVFFGGGTPSLLTLQQWAEILEAMDRLGLTGAAEWTVECNPATVSLDKARLLKSYGVNRLSMGVQSLDTGLLERLGRVHTRAMVFKSFDILRRAGFGNVNLDLMFAIPGQTRATWRETLSEAVQFGSEHLSTYEVIYEEDTALFQQMRAGRFEVNEDLACDMYEDLLDVAAGAGFRQYEVANFARRRPSVPEMFSSLDGDFCCQHNLNYWRGGSFYGAGPSATSYVRGKRSKNWSNTVLYCEQLEQGRRPIESSETLSPMARAGETAAFGLRMVDGWKFEDFRRVTGVDLATEWQSEIRHLVDCGWGAVSPERFRLTARGLRFADAAAELFLR
jgi:oxygen-independent coproporphyrinogen III oxidase